jgi:hypothetical protein
VSGGRRARLFNDHQSALFEFEVSLFEDEGTMYDYLSQQHTRHDFYAGTWTVQLGENEYADLLNLARHTLDTARGVDQVHSFHVAVTLAAGRLREDYKLAARKFVGEFVRGEVPMDNGVVLGRHAAIRTLDLAIKARVDVAQDYIQAKIVFLDGAGRAPDVSVDEFALSRALEAVYDLCHLRYSFG